MGALNVSAPSGLVLLTTSPSLIVDALTPSSLVWPAATLAVMPGATVPSAPVAVVVKALSGRRVPQLTATTTTATNAPSRGGRTVRPMSTPYPDPLEARAPATT